MVKNNATLSRYTFFLKFLILFLSSSLSKRCIFIYIRSKYLDELLLKILKEIKIFTLCNQIFSITNGVGSSVGRVMKFTASGHRCLLVEVRGKCTYMH